MKAHYTCPFCGDPVQKREKTAFHYRFTCQNCGGKWYVRISYIEKRIEKRREKQKLPFNPSKR